MVDEEYPPLYEKKMNQNIQIRCIVTLQDILLVYPGSKQFLTFVYTSLEEALLNAILSENVGIQPTLLSALHKILFKHHGILGDIDIGTLCFI